VATLQLCGIGNTLTMVIGPPAFSAVFEKRVLIMTKKLYIAHTERCVQKGNIGDR
jgi:hypothetical protein